MAAENTKLLVYKKSPDLEVTENTVRKQTYGWDNGLILIGQAVVKGSAKFTVKVLKGRKITIGVCLHDVNMNSYVNKTASGWGYYQSSGKFGHNGPAKKRGGEAYKNEPGCLITTEIDVDTGTLRFYKNGVDQGVAYVEFEEIHVSTTRRHSRQLVTQDNSNTISGDGITFVKSEYIPRTYKRVSYSSAPANDRPPAFEDIDKKGDKDSFRVYYKNDDIVINKDVVRKVSDGWDNGLVMLGEPVRKGKIKWRFQVIRGTKNTVGVCLSNVNRAGYVNKTEKGWGFYAGGRVGTGGPARKKFGRSFKIPGCVIEMEMDCDLGTLRFKLNGEDLGVAFSTLPRGAEYVAALSMYKADDAMKVTFLGAEKEVKKFPSSSNLMSELEPAPSPPRPSSAVKPKNRSISEVQPPIISEKGNLVREKSTDWLYRCASKLDLDYKNRIVKKTEHGWNDGLILLGKPVKSKKDGIARWSVRLDRTRKATIGLCQTDVDISGYVNRSAKGWGYYQSSGKIGTNGPAKENFGESFKEPGVVMDIELDSAMRTLAFYKNGVKQGVAFADLPIGNGVELVAAVSLYDKDDYCTILKTFNNQNEEGEMVLENAPTPPKRYDVVADQEKKKKKSTPSKQIRRNSESAPIRAYFKAPTIVLKGDRATKLVQGWDNGLLLLGDCISTGVARWSIRMGTCRKTTVGVCLTSVNTSGYVNKHDGGWGYYQQSGRVGHGGPAKTVYGEPFKHSRDVIDIELDCNKGTLRFYTNGVDQGIAFDNLPKRASFVGAVSLYDKNDYVIILSQPNMRRRGSMASSVSSSSSASLWLPSMDIDSMDDNGKSTLIDYNNEVTKWLLSTKSIPHQYIPHLVYALEIEGFDSLFTCSTLTQQDVRRIVSKMKGNDRTVVSSLFLAVDALKERPEVQKLVTMLLE